MERKYALLDETKWFWGIELSRIVALKTFETPYGTVRKDDIGGWIEKPYNLSQEDSCWITDDAIACMDAAVTENAVISGEAKVVGHAEVCGKASVSGNAVIDNRASVREIAIVKDKAYLADHTSVFGSAVIQDEAFLHSCSVVEGLSIVGSKANICDRMYLTGKARVFSDLDVFTVGPVTEKNFILSFFRAENGVLVTYNVGGTNWGTKPLASLNENKTKYPIFGNLLTFAKQYFEC